MNAHTGHSGKKVYISPTLTHQGSIEARTLGQTTGAVSDTGSLCPYCWKAKDVE